MNQHPGVFGRKLGMTQLFAEDGTLVPCTVVESKTVVLAKRTKDKDGYDALVVGSDEKKDGRTNKAQTGQFKKAGISPKQNVRELRGSAEFVAGFEVGQEVKVDQIFEEGQFVDVQGITKGHGFTGVVRRWGFAGNIQTHGTHEYRRHGGSIGTRMTPGRVKLGQKMGGQMGNETLSILNQKVMKLIPDQNLVLIEGGIPGARGGLVVVRGAIKKAGGKPKKK
jgi:large subunit ribosomal protein L3